MKRLISMCLVAVWALFTLAGCGEKKVVQLEENQYYIYCVHQDLTTLRTTVYTDEEKSGDIRETALLLLSQLKATTDDVETLPAIPEDVGIAKVRASESNQFFVYFDSKYEEIDPVREILCRAAIVKTLTQIDGIDFVGFYVNDQPLMDPTTGAITMMSASSFVDVDSADYQKVVLTLYFADDSGTQLVETERTVFVPKTMSREQLVMEQLIAGANQEGAYPTLPSNLSIINITVKKGTCYLNLGSEFMDNALSVSEYIPIYSIVDSLTELPNINKVQFAISGKSDINFRDIISLTSSFERKMDYVDTKE